MIIGVTGKRGCGKDTVARYLKEEYNFEMLDFTKDILAPLLVNQGKQVTRDNLIELGMGGRKKYHNGIWAEKLAQLIKMRPGKRKNFVISGVRFKEEIESFRKTLREDFILISVICDDKNRYERSMKRGTKGESNISFDDFMNTENKPTEIVINETMRLSDYVLDNNGSYDDLKKEMENLMKVLKRECR